jgi:hypothetical protein
MPNGDGTLDRLVVALPEPFPDRFARCDEFEPPVELLWFLPFAASEQHIVTDHGWRELLHWIRERGESPYDLDRTTVL